MSDAPTTQHPLQGRQFSDLKAMKTQVAAFFAADGRGFSSIGGGSKQKKWGCSGKPGGCKAEVRATLQSTKDWKVSFVMADHANCSGGMAKGKTPALAAFAATAIRDAPEVKATDIKRSFEAMTGLKVSQRTMNRARGTALKARRAAAAGTIQQAEDYCVQLVAKSPGSVATVEKNPDKSFKRMFIMLGRAAHVVHNGLFKFIQVDAGHMKGAWKGVILVATAKDANNTLVLLAFAVCDKENADNYGFLLTEMKKNASMAALLSNEGTTVYSDEHKGIAAALKRHAPRVIHRLCLHHLVKHLPGPGIGAEVNGWLFHAARAPTQLQCVNMLSRYVMPKKPQAYDALIKRDPKQWTHWAQPPDAVIMDQVTSNGAESTMNMIGHEARKLPPFGLMINMVVKAASKLADRISLGMDGDNKLTPFATKLFETERKNSNGLAVTSTGNGYYNVENTNIDTQSARGNRVHLLLDSSPPTWTCTCGYPQRFMSPCREIIAVGKELSRMDDIMELVHPSYSLDHYRRIHGDEEFRVVLPVLSLVQEDADLLPPHQVEGQSGRPKKGKDATKRIASNGEKAASAVHNVRLSQLPGVSTSSASGLSQGTGELSQGTVELSQGSGPSLGVFSAPINIP